MPDTRIMRMLPMQRAEIRIDGDQSPRIVGYASVFYDGTPETEYRMFDDLVERIMSGAFDKTLKSGDDIRGLFNHDPSLMLGRTAADTLELRQDQTGLWYECDPGDTTVASDVLKHIRRGDVTGSSFGFEVTDQTFRTVDKVDIREIRGVRVFDVGPVTFPAYEGTESKVRAEEAAEVRTMARQWKTTGRAKQRELLERAKQQSLTHRLERLKLGKNY